MTEAPGENAPSPMQNPHRTGPWRSPTTKDFLRQIRKKLALGPVYAILPADENRRADIIVRSTTGDRMVWQWTYPSLGLRAMAEAGLLVMEPVPDIPERDMGELLESPGFVRRFGDAPELRRLSLP